MNEVYNSTREREREREFLAFQIDSKFKALWIRGFFWFDLLWFPATTTTTYKWWWDTWDLLWIDSNCHSQIIMPRPVYLLWRKILCTTTWPGAFVNVLDMNPIRRVEGDRDNCSIEILPVFLQILTQAVPHFLVYHPHFEIQHKDSSIFHKSEYVKFIYSV